MDLTDPNIFASPYFYPQQNDMVYVDPNDAQKKTSRYSTNDSFKVSLFSTIATSVSIVATTILSVISIRNNR